jgi:hypothetical protein
MPAVALDEIRLWLIDDIKEAVSIIASLDPVAEIGDAFETAIAGFQALGICNLLSAFDTEGFFRNLLYSGQTRRYYLRRNADEGNATSPHLAISRNTSLFDAIAAGRNDLAQEIVNLSPTRWIPDGEYEDDYAYYAFFHAYLRQLARPDSGTLMPILAQFVKATEGMTTARYLVAESFLNEDPAEFTAAFAALLDEHKQQLAKAKPLSDDDLTFAPRSAIFVEGLALLKLAEHRGFLTEEEYEFCPAIARAENVYPMPNDLFKEIETAVRG